YRTGGVTGSVGGIRQGYVRENEEATEQLRDFHIEYFFPNANSLTAYCFTGGAPKANDRVYCIWSNRSQRWEVVSPVFPNVEVLQFIAWGHPGIGKMTFTF